MRHVEAEIEGAIAIAEGHARGGFAARVGAIDVLEVHVLDRLHAPEDLTPALQALLARAEDLHERLEATNEAVIRRLQERIRTGRYTPAGLRTGLSRLADPEADGYDTLDMFIGALLDVGPLPDAQAVREQEMVFYQPTPGRVILELVEKAPLGPEDHLIDLGSGLGHVVVLASLLSGARAIGVEFEPTYCDHAERSAELLHIERAAFHCVDARQADLADGTVYFMYTPFRGALLREVLDRLKQVAMTRPIRICTYGPCTAEVAATEWLTLESGVSSREDKLAIFVGNFHGRGPVLSGGGGVPGEWVKKPQE